MLSAEFEMTDRTGVIELHVHAGPEVRPRRLDAAVEALDPVKGMREFLQQMAGQRFSQAEIDRMTRGTPVRLLGLEPW